ncbi:MAG: hypothetical protein WBE40_07960 [Thermoplasmata archaeon]
MAACPRCGGALGPPVSGNVHCYVECGACGARFELDDPDLVESVPRNAGD